MTDAAGRADRGGRRSSHSNSRIFLKYYTDHDMLTSPEGILKLLSIVTCMASAAVLAAGAEVGAGAVGAVLAVAAAEAVLVGAHTMQLPLRAPQLFLYTDITVSTAGGVAVLAGGALGLADDVRRARSVHALLAFVTAGMLVGSAALTYSTAMKLWDSTVNTPAPARDPPSELEV